MSKKFIVFILIAVSLFSLTACDELLNVEEYERKVMLDEVTLIYKYRQYNPVGTDTGVQIFIEGEKDCFIGTFFVDIQPEFAGELVDVINQDGYHIYRSYNKILYYIEGELKWMTSRPVLMIEFNGYKEEKRAELLNVYKLLMSTNVYEYWENFAEIFVARNDSEVISTLKRWARGEFSEKERLVNEEVETLVNMKSFAQSLLTEYQIEYLEENEKVIYGYP